MGLQQWSRQSRIIRYSEIYATSVNYWQKTRGSRWRFGFSCFRMRSSRKEVPIWMGPTAIYLTLAISTQPPWGPPEVTRNVACERTENDYPDPDRMGDSGRQCSNVGKCTRRLVAALLNLASPIAGDLTRALLSETAIGVWPGGRLRAWVAQTAGRIAGGLGATALTMASVGPPPAQTQRPCLHPLARPPCAAPGNPRAQRSPQVAQK